MSEKPLCVDLFSGLGGWSEGFLAAGYDVVGFDIKRHVYDSPCKPCRGGGRDLESEVSARCEPCDGRGFTRQQYPAQLVLQDVLTIHGSQFRNAACIVASPPCENYSYLAMPWSNSKDWFRPDGDGWEQIASPAAKELRRKWEAEGPDNRLFDACFRIQREAIESRMVECKFCVEAVKRSAHCVDFRQACAGCYIPLIVENVRGAQPWVGRSAWNYGSFHLWGDVPALMPINLKRGIKLGGGRSWTGKNGYGSPDYKPFGFNTENEKEWRDSKGRTSEDRFAELSGRKGTEGINGEAPAGTGSTSWFFGKRADPRDMRLHESGEWVRPDGTTLDGLKIGGDWFSDPNSTCRKHGSRSSARKAASAQIAKIPFRLANHIAQAFKPRGK